MLVKKVFCVFILFVFLAANYIFVKAENLDVNDLPASSYILRLKK